MAGGFIAVGTEHVTPEEYSGKLTGYVVFVALMAACGGLLFGYDIGVTGGVSSMAPFQEKFFPDVYAATTGATESSPYCKYDNQILQTFTSTMFLGGLFASFFAGAVTRKLGRKATMLIASVLFMIGAGLQAGAVNLGMLFVGRLFLGFGIGSANSVVPLYISEVAPYRFRGALNMCFQLATTTGILVAGLVNYGIEHWEHAWRLSLGLAGAFAFGLFIGSIVLPESPNSLVERGQAEKGRAVLVKLRGTDDVEMEFQDIVEAVELGKSVSIARSWASLFEPAHRPMLIVTALVAFFQQFTGINAIMFYVPVLFNSLGSGRKASLLNTVIINAVNFASTFLSVLTVDRLGRRFWFLEGGIQMCVSLFVTGIVLAKMFEDHADGVLPHSASIGVLIVVCFFISAFAWSWGPLGWLVPSEIQTLETRAAGMSVAVFVNFLFSFVIGQSFLSMLCAMRWGVFLFFAGWVVVMTAFVFFYLPETKGVPVERVQVTFARHPLWKPVMGKAADEIIERDATRTASRQAMTAERAAGSVAKNSEDDIKKDYE